MGYDLICFFDALHDFGDPEGALAHAAAALAPGGAVMLVEPYAGDRVEDNLKPVGAACTTPRPSRSASRTGTPRATTPSAPRPARRALAEVCRRAGLTTVRRAAATPFNLILEARR